MQADGIILGMGKRIIICEDCGARVRRDLTSRRRGVCARCGVDRATAAALQMANKSGPAWDRFLASKGPAGRPRVRDEWADAWEARKGA
jgi:hypothetical protein